MLVSLLLRDYGTAAQREKAAAEMRFDSYCCQCYAERSRWTLTEPSDKRRINSDSGRSSGGSEMKVCHYNNYQAGVIVGDKVFNIGEALIKAGLVRNGYSMLEIIDVLANDSRAMDIARNAAQGSGGLALSSVKLLAPITNPGSLWAAAANYRAHQKEMIERMGSADRATKSDDELMAEFFLKPTSS